MEPDEELTHFRAALLRWYSKHRRAMPWRVEPGKLADPYRVLVSEVMLQQTQVTTVVAYFERFMRRFPTIDSLASASEQEVLHLWQGLGYYRRARMLHGAARAVVAECGGTVPSTVDDLLKLPGVGRYTAGAVASIAFGRESPVVDGNVARVLGRVLADRRAADDPAAVNRFWREMSRLVQIEKRKTKNENHFLPGDVNQAVMELGATVCVPRSPSCGDCPVKRFCRAGASGDPMRFGVKGKRLAPRFVVHRVVALRRGGRWLWCQRPDHGPWAGMWQMPTCETPPAGKWQLPRWVESSFGLRPGPVKRLHSFEHVTTHRRIRFDVFTAEARGGRLLRGAGRWRTLADLHELPMSNAQKRALALVTQSEKTGKQSLTAA